MHALHKYPRVERERRFLIESFPTGVNVTGVRRIVDRYIAGTRLRLRQETDAKGGEIFKLTQKLPVEATGAQQGLVTSMYLAKEEFSILAALPARTLHKSRYSVPPFGIDVFEGSLAGLVLAEAEFNSEVESEALTIPDFIVREVSRDEDSREVILRQFQGATSKFCCQNTESFSIAMREIKSTRRSRFEFHGVAAFDYFLTQTETPSRSGNMVVKRSLDS